MKNLIVLFAFTTIAASCGKSTEEFLYNKYDDDYGKVQAMYSEKCENENVIFGELQKSSDFKVFLNGKTERIFKIERKYSRNGSNEENIIQYIRFTSEETTATDQMWMIISSSNHKESDIELKNKKVLYTQKNNTTIVGVVAAAICNTTNPYTRVTPWNNTELTYKDLRDNKKTDSSKVVMNESFQLKVGFPNILSRWHSSSELTEDKIVTKYKIGNLSEPIVNNTNFVCNNDQVCAATLNTSNLPVCELVIDSSHPTRTNPYSKLTSFNNCTTE